jgi:hypothetical protein
MKKLLFTLLFLPAFSWATPVNPVDIPKMDVLDQLITLPSKPAFGVWRILTTEYDGEAMNVRTGVAYLAMSDEPHSWTFFDLGDTYTKINSAYLKIGKVKSGKITVDLPVELHIQAYKDGSPNTPLQFALRYDAFGNLLDVVPF